METNLAFTATIEAMTEAALAQVFDLAAYRERHRLADAMSLASLVQWHAPAGEWWRVCTDPEVWEGEADRRSNLPTPDLDLFAPVEDAKMALFEFMAGRAAGKYAFEEGLSDDEQRVNPEEVASEAWLNLCANETELRLVLDDLKLHKADRFGNRRRGKQIVDRYLGAAKLGAGSSMSSDYHPDQIRVGRTAIDEKHAGEEAMLATMEERSRDALPSKSTRTTTFGKQSEPGKDGKHTFGTLYLKTLNTRGSKAKNKGKSGYSSSKTPRFRTRTTTATYIEAALGGYLDEVLRWDGDRILEANREEHLKAAEARRKREERAAKKLPEPVRLARSEWKSEVKRRKKKKKKGKKRRR